MHDSRARRRSPLPEPILFRQRMIPVNHDWSNLRRRCESFHFPYNNEARMKILMWIIAIIFLIGLLVVTGVLNLVF